MNIDKGIRRQGDKGWMLRLTEGASTLLALCLGVAGCQQEDTDSEPVTAAASSSEADTGASDDVEATDDTQQGAADSPESVILWESNDPEIELTPADLERLRAQLFFNELLQSPSPEEWDQAQAELKELGQAAVPVLIESLESSSRNTREMAAQHFVLLELDLSQETEPLLAALDDDSVQVRTYCAAVLLTQSPDAAEQAVATLIDVLRRSDAAMSEMAASYLQTFPESVAGQLPQVIEALHDAPPKVAVPLIKALAAAGPQAVDATEVLTELAEADDPEIAAAARQAIDAISGPSE